MYYTVFGNVDEIADANANDSPEGSEDSNLHDEFEAFEEGVDQFGADAGEQDVVADHAEEEVAGEVGGPELLGDLGVVIVIVGVEDGSREGNGGCECEDDQMSEWRMEAYLGQILSGIRMDYLRLMAMLNNN